MKLANANKFGITELFYVFLAFTLVFDFGLSQFTSPVFHETYSDGCLQAGITSETDCPSTNGKPRWSSEQNTPESDRRFKPTSSNKNGVSRRCFSKLLVQARTCNSRPNCEITTYKYILPKKDGADESSYCAKDWSFESKCMDDGPGGKNTKLVHFNCFKKRSRSYCGVDFESCEPIKCFKWTGYRRQCLMECETPKHTGVAMQFRRTCRKCDGGQVSASLCPGGEANSTKLGRCIERSRVKAKAPDCIIDTTAVPTKSTTTKTTTESTTKTASQQTIPKTTETTTTISKITIATTILVTTTKPISTTTLFTTPETTSTQTSTTSSYVTTKPTLKSPDDTTSSPNTRPTTTHDTTSNAESTQAGITTKPIHGINERILVVGLPDFDFTPPPPLLPTATANNSLGGLSNLQKQNDSFQLITIAGGAGAGVVFIILIMIIVILLVKRKTPKRVPAPVLTTSSTGRPNSPGNPVVDSSSFRIATWIRERPSLRNMSRTSSTSVVSDAEYWRVGRSSDDKTPSPTQPSISEELSGTKQKPLERYDDHIYDEVSFGVVEDNMGTFVQVDRRFPKKGRHISINSVQSEPMTSTVDFPNNENAIYAVVNKSRKKTPLNKKSCDSTSSGSRREVASEHVASITRLNGRHLREGVLQIEFDEKEGVRCKLSDSDVYMNLEETEPPQVI